MPPTRNPQKLTLPKDADELMAAARILLNQHKNHRHCSDAVVAENVFTQQSTHLMHDTIRARLKVAKAAAGETGDVGAELKAMVAPAPKSELELAAEQAQL